MGRKYCEKRKVFSLALEDGRVEQRLRPRGFVWCSNQDVSLVLELVNMSSHLLDFQYQHSAQDPAPPIVLEPQQCQR